METRIEVETLIEVYKQEIARLQDENMMLKVRLLQIEKDNIKREEEVKEKYRGENKWL